MIKKILKFINKEPILVTSSWQQIFSQSKVNGAPYHANDQSLNWEWPRDTPFQKRLSELRRNNLSSSE